MQQRRCHGGYVGRIRRRFQLRGFSDIRTVLRKMLNDASVYRLFCFLMNIAAEYCTAICGDSGFIVPVPVLSSTIYLYNYCVQRCFCFRMNTACLSAYNYVYVPEHLHYILSQDLVWLVRLCADSDRNTTLLFFAPRRLYFRCGDYISAPGGF